MCHGDFLSLATDPSCISSTHVASQRCGGLVLLKRASEESWEALKTTFEHSRAEFHRALGGLE
jgi:hypothetical protein